MGFNKENKYDETGEEYNPEGYNYLGFDRQGYNKQGLNAQNRTREAQAAYENTRRKYFLGLRSKAVKLATGKMSVLEYMQCSKNSLEDLIDFAKKQNMDHEIIVGLYGKEREFIQYKKSFDRKKYLENVEIIVRGEIVKPTEDDVDKCIAYMQAYGKYICDKTVRTTVKDYLKGVLDISIPEDFMKNSQENQVDINNVKCTELETFDGEQVDLYMTIEEVNKAIEKAKKT